MITYVFPAVFKLVVVNSRIRHLQNSFFTSHSIQMADAGLNSGTISKANVLLHA